MRNARGYRNKLVFALGIAAGVLIWLCSKDWFGHAEPWDGNLYLYAVVLAALGALLAWIGEGKFWLPYVSLYLGQFLFGLWSFASDKGGGANLFPIGAVMLTVFTLPALVGSILQRALGRVLFGKREPPSAPDAGR